MERITRIDIGGARIERIPPPIVELLPAPTITSEQYPTLKIPRPVVDIPQVRIDYPTLPAVPLPAPKTGGKQQEVTKEDSKPERKLPEPKLPPPPVVVPPIPRVEVTRPVERPEIAPTETNFVEIAGHEIHIPTPKEVVQASTTAVLGTSATLATAMVFNQGRRAVSEAITKAKRNRFKIRLRAVKPVLHLIQEEAGITVLEYSANGVRTLATGVENPEQFLRDTIEADELYEVDHKIVIDEPIREMFSREGAKRFNYFAPAKKLARRLSARLTLG